jgi:hypothetical protein
MVKQGSAGKQFTVVDSGVILNAVKNLAVRKQILHCVQNDIRAAQLSTIVNSYAKGWGEAAKPPSFQPLL